MVKEAEIYQTNYITMPIRQVMGRIGILHVPLKHSLQLIEDWQSLSMVCKLLHNQLNYLQESQHILSLQNIL